MPEATKLLGPHPGLMPAKRLDPLALVEVVPRIEPRPANQDLLRLRLCGSRHHNRSSQNSNRENLCHHPSYVCDLHDVLLATHH